VRSDLTWNVLAKNLEGLSQRFDAVSSNIANANTPRYARREVRFEDQLQALLDAPKKLPLAVTDERHMALRPLSVEQITPREVRPVDEIYRLDGNNVDPEVEMARLAETRMAYNATNRLVSKKAGLYRLAIGGR
jgi:flagellar basal-body rod protein FlgB